MSERERISEVLAALSATGFEAAEVFHKVGRSRRYEIGPGGRLSGTSEELGWAVRATTPRASIFACSTGRPEPDSTWPEADGRPLRLPVPEPVAAWTPPQDLGQALMSESEAMSLLEGIEAALASELGGGRLIRGLLEEGTSESWIASTLGIDSEFRSRAVSLIVEAIGPWPDSSTVTVRMAMRQARELSPEAIARRAANRLVLTRERSDFTRERGEMILSAAVVARILGALMPLWLGHFEAVAEPLQPRRARIASSQLSIVDDGRLSGGVLESPVDGEGRPTGQTVVMEQGHFRQPLCDWRRREGTPEAVPGCIRRDSWADLPRVGPSHLYCLPGEASLGELLTSVARGFYLIEAEGAGSFDLAADRFELPVCGFQLRQGKAVGPVAKAWLEGPISTLLNGVEAAARDLVFQPQGAMIGAPSLLTRGCRLRAGR